MKRYKVEIEVRQQWVIHIDAEDETDAVDRAWGANPVDLDGDVTSEYIENVGLVEEVLWENEL